jgi:putative transposase
LHIKTSITYLRRMSAHRKTVRRIHEPGDVHALTFSCDRRKPLLTNEAWRVLLAESLDRAMLGQSCHLVAYVFMPEHVHLLVQPTHNEVRIDLLLKAIKAPYSNRLRRQFEEADSPLLNELIVRERPGVYGFRFWQEGGGYDRNLRTEAAVMAAIDDIHANPVRRGLCQEPADWRWSSARHYRDDHSGNAASLPTIHGLTWDFFA